MHYSKLMLWFSFSVNTCCFSLYFCAKLCTGLVIFRRIVFAHGEQKQRTFKLCNVQIRTKCLYFLHCGIRTNVFVNMFSFQSWIRALRHHAPQIVKQRLRPRQPQNGGQCEFCNTAILREDLTSYASDSFGWAFVMLTFESYTGDYFYWKLFKVNTSKRMTLCLVGAHRVSMTQSFNV